MSTEELTKPKRVANNKGKRTIPIEKAIKILSDYKKNNYNAYKTLIENGYSELYANANSKQTITSAKERVEQSLELKDMNAKQVSDVVSDLYATIGISREQVLKEYRSILEQNINLAVKLRALEPLLRQENVSWSEKQQESTPSVVIKVEEVNNYPQIEESSPNIETPSE